MKTDFYPIIRNNWRRGCPELRTKIVSNWSFCSEIKENLQS